MDTEILEDLGLTQAEIKVYLALLELGTCTAGPILEKSGLQNSVVHRALNTLIEKSLINYVHEGKRKVYQATNPEYFFNFIEDKKKHFEQILPELKKRQKQSEKRETATIYKGIRGIKEVYSIMIAQKTKEDKKEHKKNEYNTFGGGYPCEKLMGTTWWLNLHARRIANKLPARQVFDETVRKIGNVINKKPLSRVRFISKDFYQAQEIIIVGNKVAIAVFAEHPYAFLIQDTLVADSYRKYFELLWKIAKP